LFFNTKSFTFFGSNEGRGDDPEVIGRAYFQLNYDVSIHMSVWASL